MLTKDYQEAFAQVLAIVDLDQNFKMKIPKKLIQFFKENASSDYQIDFDTNLKIKDMPLKKETRGLLSMLYRNYICDSDDKKQEFDNILRENSIKREQELREKYNPDNIFKKPETIISNSNQSSEITTNSNLITYKENIFTKLFNKIKNFIKKQK